MPTLSYLFDKILEIDDQIGCVNSDDKQIIIGCENGDIIVWSPNNTLKANVHKAIMHIGIRDNYIAAITTNLDLHLFMRNKSLIKIGSQNLRDFDIKEIPQKMNLLKNEYNNTYSLLLQVKNKGIVMLDLDILSNNLKILQRQKRYIGNIMDFDTSEEGYLSILRPNKVELYNTKDFLEALKEGKYPNPISYLNFSPPEASLKLSPKVSSIVLLNENPSGSYNLIWIPINRKKHFSFGPKEYFRFDNKSSVIIKGCAFSLDGSYFAIVANKRMYLYFIKVLKEGSKTEKMYNIELPIDVNEILWHGEKVILRDNKVLLSHDIRFANRIFNKIINPLKEISKKFSEVISQDNFSQATLLAGKSMLLLASSELLNALQKVGTTEAENLLKGTIIPDEYLKAAEEIINKTLKSKEIVPKERQIIDLLKDVLIEIKKSVKKPEKLSEILINVADISSEALGLTITSPVWTIASFLVPMLFIIRNKLRERV